MFGKRQSILLFLFVVGIFLVTYSLANKKRLLREYLTASPPTVTSLQKDLEATQKKLDTLNSEFQAMKTQAQAQAQDAAAAKASLAAIR